MLPENEDEKLIKQTELDIMRNALDPASRIIDRWEDEQTVVSTVEDYGTGSCPFETAILNAAYDDNYIVVQHYNSIDGAKKGHDVWVNVFKNHKFEDWPKVLTDIDDSEIAKAIDERVGSNTWRVYHKQERTKNNG